MSFHLDDIKGGWAIVTGATSDVGREYARTLGRAGLNQLLVARRQAGLAALAAEIEAQSGLRAVAMALDLTAPDAAKQVLQALQIHPGARLRLLFSYTGVGRPAAHQAAHRDSYAAMINLNVAAVVSLTTTLLPALQASAPSAVVHVSSQAAYQPVPYLAVYAASKAFVHHFSLALHEEQRGQGVMVQTLVPAPTDAEVDALAGTLASAGVQRGSAADVVRASIDGLNRGAAVATNASGIWKQRLFAGLAPPAMVVREVAKMFKPPAQA